MPPQPIPELSRPPGLELGGGLRRPPDLADFQLFERSVAGPDLAGFVTELRRLRPAADLVGASPRFADELDFHAVGVKRFLQVPWRVGDLLHVLGS